MKRCVLLLLLVSVAVAAQDVPKTVGSCLIVKRRTESSKVGMALLLGFPAMAVNWYNYVESDGVVKPKKAYGGSELKKMEKAGVHVEILPADYTQADLDRAHKACSEN